MQDLIGSLVSQLGITQSQAQGGAGAIFKAARERLGTGQFEQLLGGVPGVKELLAHAPTAGGGMLGGLAAMAGIMGGSDMAQAAQLLAAVNSIGIDKDTLMKFIPIVMKFLEDHGGPQLVAHVRAALKL